MPIPSNNIGTYRFRLEIQAPVLTQDDAGQVNTNDQWQLVTTRWGSIVPLSSREYVWANQLYSDVTHKIQLRYYPDIKSSWRIVCGEDVYHLAGDPIDEDRMKAHITLICKQVVDSGVLLDGTPIVSGIDASKLTSGTIDVARLANIGFDQLSPELQALITGD